MQREKRRPTLEELRSLPPHLWLLEVAHIGVEASRASQPEIDAEADRLLSGPELTPEKVVALREKLQRATGSTAIEDAAQSAQPDAA